jgi:class 3 adenylate cyclase
MSSSCIALELNERLGYFGQTVNIAARVQGLADANEIVVPEFFFAAQGVAELAAAASLEPTREKRQPQRHWRGHTSTVP